MDAHGDFYSRKYVDKVSMTYRSDVEEKRFKLVFKGKNKHE
jgi:hypothetical protein